MSPAGFSFGSRLPSQGAFQQHTNEPTFFGRFAGPISIDVASISHPTGGAGAEAAVDTAFPIFHGWAVARRTRTGTRSAARCVVHLRHMLRWVSVHRVGLGKFWTPGLV